jgi:hypothetical protein
VGRKPPYYYFDSPVADREEMFDEAFRKELRQLLEEQTEKEPKELTQLVFKLMRSGYRLICKWGNLA